MSYERKTADAKPREDFWAHIDRPVPEDKAAGIGQNRSMVLRSPSFQSEADMRGWIRAHVKPGDELHAYRRELSEGGFKDRSLDAHDDDFPPNQERLAKLLAELRLTIDAGRALAKPSGRTYRTDAQRGVEARARLERAGQAVKDSEAV